MKKINILGILIAMSVALNASANPNASKIDKAVEHSKASMKEAKSDVKTAISDSAITAKVKEALLEDPEVSALKIHATTNNKVVTLKGKVNTLREKNTAIYLANSIEGVKAVNATKLTVS